MCPADTELQKGTTLRAVPQSSVSSAGESNQAWARTISGLAEHCEDIKIRIASSGAETCVKSMCKEGIPGEGNRRDIP